MNEDNPPLVLPNGYVYSRKVCLPYLLLYRVVLSSWLGSDHAQRARLQTPLLTAILFSEIVVFSLC
jgi:hypothetical protein